jgi:hypothetical protein
MAEKKGFWAGLKDAGETANWGMLNPALICPHCQTKELVRTKHVERKAGISGAKATGALLTGGAFASRHGAFAEAGLHPSALRELRFNLGFLADPGMRGGGQ